MSSSVGKRQRERQKIERAHAKAERRAAGRAAAAEPVELVSNRTEPELIEELAALHRSFEAGEISAEDFEERRDGMQAEFEGLSR